MKEQVYNRSDEKNYFCGDKLYYNSWHVSLRSRKLNKETESKKIILGSVFNG